jgi:acetyl-CoA carboxylase carboxyl transferase subunit alpha
VISPEGAASILWRDSTRAKEAATNMKITSEDLRSLGIIDGIIPEPLGGAHRDPDSVIAAAGDVINNALAELNSRTGEQLRNDRRQKFLNMGRNL